MQPTFRSSTGSVGFFDLVLETIFGGKLTLLLRNTIFSPSFFLHDAAFLCLLSPLFFLRFIKKSVPTSNIESPPRVGKNATKSKDSPGEARCSNQAMILFRARVSVLGTAAAVPFPSFPPSPLVLDLFFGSCSPCSVSTYYLRLSCGPFTSSRIRNEATRDRIRPARFPICPILLPKGTEFLFSSHKKKERHQDVDSLYSLSCNSIDPLRGNVTVFTLLILNQGYIFRMRKSRISRSIRINLRQLQNSFRLFLLYSFFRLMGQILFKERAIRKMSNCVSC